MQNKPYYNTQLRDDERKCPYCNSINNVINDKCLECGKALSDKQILQEISAYDNELMPLAKRIRFVGKLLLISRMVLLLAVTGCTVTIARKVDKKIIVILAAIAALFIMVHGIVTIYSSILKKSLIKKSESKIQLFKEENGFEFNDQAREG